MKLTDKKLVWFTIYIKKDIWLTFIVEEAWPIHWSFYTIFYPSSEVK